MYFDVSSNENLRRITERAFYIESIFHFKIDDITENTQIIDHVILSKAAKNFDFVERVD